MKYKLLPCLFMTLLVGYDRTEAILSFTPEMANLSNEFDLDPLCDPVEDFIQTLMDEQGEVTKHASGTLPERGCFGSLGLPGLENNTLVALVLDASCYRNAEMLEKRVRLQGKCQLAELPSVGVSRETNSNGFVIKASSKRIQMEYRHDDQRYPLGEATRSNDRTLSVSATPSTNPIKKLDYTAAILLNNRRIGDAEQSCGYDNHANSVDRQLITVDEGVKLAVERVYTIKNTTDYY